MILNKNDETPSWFEKIKQKLSAAPTNQNELLDLLRELQAKTIITPETMMILEGALVFSEMRARDIMIPKNQLIYFDKQDPYDKIIEKVLDSGHSRFPVTDNNLEGIIGILHAKDLLNYTLTNPEQFDLLALCRQATFIPESKRLDSLLREFRHNKNHMAIVVDEYGAVSGFITIEDIIEQIVGDIEDEFDIEEEPYIKSHPNKHYVVRAQMPIDEFNEEMQSSFSDEIYDTIGGIVMASFGHLPKRGESISIADIEFTVLSSDARHIKLLEAVDNRPSDLEEGFVP